MADCRRQFHGEAGTPLGPRSEPDRVPRKAGERLPHDRQSEPVAVLGIARAIRDLKILVEHAALIGCGDADPVVAYQDRQALSGVAHFDQHPRAAIGRRELQRIADQVRQDVPQPVLVGDGQFPRRGHAHNEPDTAPHRLSRIDALDALEHAAQVHPLDGQRRTAVEQAAQFGQPIEVAAEHPDASIDALDRRTETRCLK